MKSIAIPAILRLALHENLRTLYAAFLNAKGIFDNNVISELRKKTSAIPGVKRFFQQAAEQDVQGYFSIISVGELSRGVELIRHIDDKGQTQMLKAWLQAILDFTADEVQVWGCLRAPHHKNALDKQIAATAHTHGLTLVTGNVDDFAGSGVHPLNPSLNILIILLIGILLQTLTLPRQASVS